MIQDIFAAGVLIQRDDGKILATKRTDGKGYGFPCGKREIGENPLHTAVRECFEETGHVAIIDFLEGMLSTYSLSYTDLDDSNHMIRIYRAESVAVGEPTHPEEGEVVWVTPRALVEESAWTEYNELALKHFGINWE